MAIKGGFEKNSNLWAWLALLPIVFLCSLGIITLISIGAPGKADPYFFVKRQLVWLGFALVLGFGAAFVNLKFLKKISLPLAIFSIILLLAVLIPQVGKEVNGARRWIDIAGFTFQPSDIAKFAIILLISSYLCDNQRRMKTFWRGFVFPFAILGFFCALIIAEPDFGTTALCGAVGCVLIYLAGVNLKYFMPCVATAISAFCVLIYFSPVRRARILSFLDFEENKLAGGYQLYQSIVGFTSGGIEGLGLGKGRQHLSFLPEAHTDFIFAPIGEQMGLFATLGVALAFFMIFLAAIVSLKKAPNLFEFCICTGAIMMITIQALFNMCVVTGLLPTKGISLPFISYGGSNLVVMFVFTGIILNCIMSWNKPRQIRTSDL